MHRWKRYLVVAAASLIGFGAACDSGSSDKKDDKTKKSAEAESPEKGDKEKAGDKAKSAESGGEVPFEATGPVAKVNGTEIGAAEYNELVQKMFGNSRRPLPKQLADRFKGRTLDQIVDKHLIQNAIDEAGVEVSDEELKAEIEQIKERFPEGKNLESLLKMRNMTKEEFEEQVQESLAVKKLLQKNKGIEVTEEDAQKYYDENPSKFEQPEKVKASHILIKTKKGASEEEVEKARKKAEKLAKKARKEGTDFAKLAKEKSEGPSARKGGDLGYFSKERMVPEFSKKAFSMKDGEISDPVKTRFGFHVIKRTGHKEAKTETFADAKSGIVSQLESQKMRKAMKGWVKELRDGADVKKMPENIEINEEATAKGGMPGMGGGGGGAMKQKIRQQLQKKMQQRKQQQQNQGASGDESK